MADEAPQKSGFNLAAFLRQLTTGQLISLGVMVLAGLVLIISVFLYTTQERYVPLFREPMEAKTFMEVKDILDNRKVPYKTERNNKILVPESLSNDLRIELEAQDISAAGPDGYDVLDKTNPLKAGETILAMQKLRAKEANLAKYLKQNPMVRNAFVQITPGKDSPFADESRRAKASVMLVLTDFEKLSNGSIEGMQRYVAGAIESAELEDVVITDQYHRVLSIQAYEDDATGTSQKNIAIRQELENKLVQKVMAVVEPIMGPNKAVANVSLDVDFDKVERVEKKFGGPDAEGEPQAVYDQSKQEAVNRGAGNGLTAGAGDNTAQGAIPETGNAMATQKTSNTRQFLVDETNQTVVQAPFEIKRISVALNLDYKENEVVKEKPNVFMRLVKQDADWIETESVPLTAGELDQISELVKASVGFVENRDKMSIHNFKFQPMIGLKARASMEMSGFTENLRGWVPIIIQFIIFTVLFMTGVRMFKRFVAPILAQAQMEEPALVSALPSSTPKTVAELESEIEQELEAGLPARQMNKGDIIRKRVAEVAQTDPVATASLLRTWLLEDD
ncbi:MAG: flagellar M-ring protein FliF [Acidobacteria bacterium]|nr:flagellar M-ring protein FliF [Acidobacteriota bacterium]